MDVRGSAGLCCQPRCKGARGPRRMESQAKCHLPPTVSPCVLRGVRSWGAEWGLRPDTVSVLATQVTPGASSLRAVEPAGNTWSQAPPPVLLDTTAASSASHRDPGWTLSCQRYREAWLRLSFVTRPHVGRVRCPGRIAGHREGAGGLLGVFGVTPHQEGNVTGSGLSVWLGNQPRSWLSLLQL